MCCAQGDFPSIKTGLYNGLIDASVLTFLPSSLFILLLYFYLSFLSLFYAGLALLFFLYICFYLIIFSFLFRLFFSIPYQRRER